MSQMSQQVLGNTKPKPCASNKRIRSRKWCLTINNWSDDEYKKCVSMSQDSLYYIIGQEGEEKTKHLQIYFEFKNQVDLSKIKKELPRAHIEKAKGSRKKNYEYCSKEKNFITNIDLRTFQEKLMQKILDEEYKDVKWKPFQKKVLNILEKPPDKRKIYWFYEKTGNIGKSYLSKFIKIKYKNVILCEGKKADIFNSVRLMLEKEIIPKIILLDVPRSNQDFINYGAIEQLKNGMLYSGKYEGGDCIFPHPHVIIFSNELPEKNKMSKDRWAIEKI